MTVRIAQFVHATNDVVDEAFLREFPEIEAVKADSLETLADALLGAESSTSTIPPSRRSSRNWYELKSRCDPGSSTDPAEWKTR